jgi:hypothetical protein
MDFSRSRNLILRGEDAAREALGKIHASLPLNRRIAHFAGRFVKRGKRGKRSFLRAVSAFVEAPRDLTPKSDSHDKG